MDITFADLLQLGFAGAMAFVLVFVLWKIVTKGITAIQDMQAEHKADINSLQDDHRNERTEFYDKYAKTSEEFNKTVMTMTRLIDKD